MIKLPSLDHLRAFEASGRHLSFKKASEELNVTPAAIGQRVRILEQQLKTPLFVRRTRKITLTSEGAHLLSDVQSGMDIISRGITHIQRTQQQNTLTISTTNSFAEMCLLPILPQFSRQYPDFNVRVFATDNHADFTQDNVDIAIRFGRGNYPNLNQQHLMNATYIPVCSPELLPETQAADDPLQLADFMLIETDWAANYDAAPSWKKWFRYIGQSIPDHTRFMQVSVESHAIKAAQNGQGVALVQRIFVDDALRDGNLVQLLGQQGTIPADFRYDLIWPIQDESTLCAHFRKWASNAFNHI